MDVQYYKYRIERKEMYLKWLHEQALSGLSWEIVAEILETKAVNYLQMKAYQENLMELTQSVDIKKKGENDGNYGGNNYFNS